MSVRSHKLMNFPNDLHQDLNCQQGCWMLPPAGTKTYVIYTMGNTVTNILHWFPTCFDLPPIQIKLFTCNPSSQVKWLSNSSNYPLGWVQVETVFFYALQWGGWFTVRWGSHLLSIRWIDWLVLYCKQTMIWWLTWLYRTCDFPVTHPSLACSLTMDKSCERGSVSQIVRLGRF